MEYRCQNFSVYFHIRTLKSYRIQTQTISVKNNSSNEIQLTALRSWRRPNNVRNKDLIIIYLKNSKCNWENTVWGKEKI